MSFEDRPKPEELLKIAEQEETSHAKGHLKIFLGMAAGVGKTYSMLENAQKLNEKKVDIVIGIIDTHGRQETANLMKGLPGVPPLIIAYRDKEFEELNLDAIIKLHPEVVLVDELAHSNVPGCRHLKRWQDVLEILDNGIDVFATLNVQHIESLKDTIEDITGIVIRETVPDGIIDQASSIQLVDLTPDELLQRLKDGKIYLGEQSVLAAHHFFQKDKMTALRELVLRYTAQKIERELSEKDTEWHLRERLLVTLSESLLAEKLIRAARTLAIKLNAEWIALFVNTGRKLSDEENAILNSNLSLAHNLGAEVITVDDIDISRGIQSVLRQKRITQIVVGRPSKHNRFSFFRRKPLADILTEASPDVDIHIIRQDTDWKPVIPSLITKIKAFWSNQKPISYLLALFVALALIDINWLLVPLIGYQDVSYIFLLGIFVSSFFFNTISVVLTSVLFVFIWTNFFIPEKSFEDLSRDDIILFSLVLLSALINGILRERDKKQKEVLMKSEASIQALYDLVKEIASVPPLPKLLTIIKERLGSILNGKFEILLRETNSRINVSRSPFFLTNDKEINTALWTYENGKEAGWSTTTLPTVRNLYLPLKGLSETVGVLIFRPQIQRVLTIEEKNILYTIGQQLAIHIEQILQNDKHILYEHLSNIENIQTSALSAIVEGLQESVFSIYQAICELKCEPFASETKMAKKQIDKIEKSANSLKLDLSNMIVLGRLEDPKFTLKKHLHKLQDVIMACQKKISEHMARHKFIVKLHSELPEFLFDASLIDLLLTNLFLNAIQNSPIDTKIEVEVKRVEGNAVITILDEGTGLPADKLELVFNKFYRNIDTKSSGVGLGLTAAKKIAEVHSGHLNAENRPTGGLKLILTLPIKGDSHAKHPKKRA